MKIHNYTAAAMFATTTAGFLPHLTQAWVTTTPTPALTTSSITSLFHCTTSMKHQQQRCHFIYTTGSRSSSSSKSLLKSSVMAEEEADIARLQQEQQSSSSTTTLSEQEEEETRMALGTVVSFIPGGLVAVRIDEENLDKNDDDTTVPTVLSPTDVSTSVPRKKQFSSDSGGDLVGHLVVLPNGEKGVVVCHRAPIAYTLLYDRLESFDGQEGSVSVMKEKAAISIEDKQKMVKWSGLPTSAAPVTINSDEMDDDSKVTTTAKKRAMFAPIPQVKDIALINNPMLTGNTMVDVLAPIGQGQNMLVIADDLTVARSMMCDFISTQMRSNKERIGSKNRKETKFVYAAIDNSHDVVEKLNAAGLTDDVHVVMPDNDKEMVEAAKAAEATACAATACAIAESYAVEQGMNTVVIIDTLDQHKKLWDATTHILVDVFGVESVVKSDREGGASSEMRGFFSSIVQRSAQYKEKRGGGSVTLLLLCRLPAEQSGDEDIVYSETDFENSTAKVRARIQLLVGKGIPLTAANLRKIDIPVPSDSDGQRRLILQHIDDLISMSDGQIYLERQQTPGRYPPIDPQKSITRIGIGSDTQSRADAPALRRIAEGLRLALSQAASMEGAEDTVASKKQVRTRNALLLAMHQEEGGGGRTLSESCVALLAATNGLLDDAIANGKLAGTEAGQKLMNGMLDHVRAVVPAAMLTIDQTLDLTAETKKEILEAIEIFLSS